MAAKTTNLLVEVELLVPVKVRLDMTIQHDNIASLQRIVKGFAHNRQYDFPQGSIQEVDIDEIKLPLEGAANQANEEWERYVEDHLAKGSDLQMRILGSSALKSS